MRFNYKLNNVLGSVYNSGSICFTPDGNGLLSPVGNKIINYDLRNNRSFAYGFESMYNFDQLSISPNGSLLLATTEKNNLYMCSLVSGVMLHCKTYKKANRLTSVRFSPDGRFYALAADSSLLIYITPGQKGADGVREISPFKIHRVFNCCYDDITCVAWSLNSRLIAVGSRDMTIKIISVYKNYRCVVNLAGHTHVIQSCFFSGHSKNSLDLYSISTNGQLMHWQTDNTEDQLAEMADERKKLIYRKQSRYYLTDNLKGNTVGVQLTSAEYFSRSGLLVTGYSNGAFLLHELPSFSLIHSLELSSTGSIDSVCINRDGEWIGLASSIHGNYNLELETHSTTESKLVVWEWQSESFVLKQTGSGSGVLSICEAIAYSPDGNSVASGSCGGQVKLWNTVSGFCYVTLPDGHSSPVTGLEFVSAKGGKVLCSCSLDGTIRAYDLNRYRNFRTMQPNSKQTQFCCLSVDQQSGDLVAAGAQNTFEIYVFSLTTGRQLDELAGHTGPVSAVRFSPQGNLLASVSWDGTVRLWDLFESAKCHREIITLGSDCVALAFHPDGNQLCVSTSNSRLHFIDVRNAELDGVSIDCSSDLGKSQAKHELQQQKDKHCTCVTYSGDGHYVMGGGQSRYLCLYNVDERLLVKKYSLSFNLSLNGFQEFVSKRKLAEFGFSIESIKLREEDDGHMIKPIQLPGVAKGDLTEREVSASIATMGICFSPTMRSFVIASTEGVLMFSLDNATQFDPFHLEAYIKPATIKSAIGQQQYLDAVMQSLKLNEQSLVQMAFERVPSAHVQYVVAALPLTYAERALSKLATLLENSRHLEFHLQWVENILRAHGLALKNMTSNTLPSVLRLMQRNLLRHMDDLDQLCSGNKYMLRLVHDLHQCHRKRCLEQKNQAVSDSEGEDENMYDDAEENHSDQMDESGDELIQKLLREEESDENEENSNDTTNDGNQSKKNKKTKTKPKNLKNVKKTKK